MNKRIAFLFMGILPLLGGWGCTPGVPCEPGGDVEEPEWALSFQSGFGGTVQVTDREDRRADIVGREPALDRSDWEADLERGSPFGVAQIFFEDGATSQRDVELITDPNDSENSVMEYRISEPHIPGASQPKARIQLGLNNNEQLFSVRYSVRVRLLEGFEALEAWEREIHWLTLAEFWNNLPGEDHTFRVTLNLNKEENGPLVWNSHAQTQGRDGGPWTDVWEERNEDAPVPIDEWFTLDVLLVEGCEQDGRYEVSITLADGTRHEVMQVRGTTHHPTDPAPDGFGNINPLKLYTSGELVDFVRGEGAALRVLWDDFVLESGQDQL